MGKETKTHKHMETNENRKRKNNASPKPRNKAPVNFDGRVKQFDSSPVSELEPNNLYDNHDQRKTNNKTNGVGNKHENHKHMETYKN